ncbi:DUF3775 domain-containing protein [Falsiroseomonas tokyonensis]|uniref:DUF3775 domain-containing protein n=1 Tax=Falsiroseomonas tokyonensis TaxID=430521 RepID=A0ABV7BYN4_9PROT|nr:DUF3775 domain-containing protein [Falsiroseomonas tokyonensis]MBU8539163.1 DUF3775 domain-containing protein [Falsiroseomonas tokyonensis]
MSGRNASESDFDLVVSLPDVVAIIDTARAAGEMQEETANEEMQDPETPDDLDPDALSAQLEARIAALNEDEQAALIALAWIGRGDYGAAEWDEARRMARERAAGGGTARYLAEMELLGDLLSEGLAELGLPAEEEER